ncbi:MAG TPA: nicotinate phosphoribosyltransferase, partial [Gemmatimonadales bacterium]|nr:nicotinate phosphoribosyltransferase [Gemmatimonadales bacterium]
MHPLTLRDPALFTDLYELTMAAAFFREDMRETATFSLFARRLPPTRAFIVAAGLEDALAYARGLHFGGDAVEYLRSLGRFEPEFLEYLASLRFTGEIRAVPEGTIVFPDEPMLEVTAPVIEAQLLESALLNACHLQSVLASKAARVAIAARGRELAEFGLRRSHGTDAALKAARCAWIAGFGSTSNVLAGRAYGIPVSGTMAHSFVTSFGDELEAFRAYARAFPDTAVLLIDSYDTLEGARKAVTVARELAATGHALAAVRLDSGDLLGLSREVRRILDDAGLPGVRIVASGGLDEHDIAALVAAGAPVDAFGVGTRLNVSADAPYLDLVYKLVRYGGREVLKLSEGKETWVGAKALYRTSGANGKIAGDVLALEDEVPPPGAGASLLQPVLRDGEPLRSA